VSSTGQRSFSIRDRVLNEISLQATVAQVVVQAEDCGFSREQLLTTIEEAWDRLDAGLQDAEAAQAALDGAKEPG
jgi:hypothetical protein